MGSVDESVDVDETQGLVSGGYHKGYTGHLDKINYINEDDLPDPPCFPIMPKALGKPYKPMDPAVSREAPAIFKPKNFGLDDDGKPKFTWKDDKIFDYAYCSLNGFGGHQVCYCNPKGCLGHNQVMKCCGQMQATSCMRTDQRACLQIQSEEDQCPFLCDGQKDTCLLAYGSSSMTSYACCCFTKMVQMGNCDFKRAQKENLWFLPCCSMSSYQQSGCMITQASGMFTKEEDKLPCGLGIFGIYCIKPKRVKGGTSAAAKAIER